MILQRRLIGDGARWRSVVRFSLRLAPQVQRGAELLAAADAGSQWRVVDGAEPMRVLAQWDGSSWAI
jgi:hypothetical protein